jgi:hypothetical protein
VAGDGLLVAEDDLDISGPELLEMLPEIGEGGAVDVGVDGRHAAEAVEPVLEGHEERLSAPGSSS